MTDLYYAKYVYPPYISRRLLSFRVTLVGKQAEGPQLVFHLDANISPGAIIH